MKTVWKLYAATVLLSACGAVSLLSACAETQQAEERKLVVQPSLTDRIQAAVTEEQKNGLEALPEEIAGLKSVEPVADREKNQRGAGFVRVYADGDLMATVFVYNNRNFGVSEEIDPVMEALMDT